MVTIRYFAAARAARGSASEQVEWQGPLADLLQRLGAEHTQRTAGGLTLAGIFPRCSFLLNGTRVDADAQVQPGDQLDVLPPFAGG
ncbi:MoaD/ThiS family protein [Corynebacterium falsenii]|uniref:MoaD/ThiS family protein n=1 Tax=Corynebacterium falsenii TaxID=108486 RepID=UPI001DB94C95|nr:MoaD/ThiS family protein [Corynebacterium falsenii]MDC7103146.1 MoaD/ThiS family protein [Corynebacterium falsenii]HJF11860.1 MoaD/ThiS family protein [Corynebacterium falsenii]